MKTNIIDKYINFSKKNLMTYAKLILEKFYIDEIFNIFLEAYIASSFYNYYDNLTNFDDISVKQYLKTKKDEAFEDTLFYKEEIDNNYQAFMYAIELNDLLDFDGNNVFEKIKNFRIKLFNIEDNSLIELESLVKENILKKNTFFKQYMTDDFYIIYKKTSIYHLYDTEIKHNIKFSELYSEMAINKAFNKDLINEQKMFVYYYLLSMEILQNVLNKKNQKEYLVDFDFSLFDKEKKIKRLLLVIDNDLLKEKMIYKITYEIYLANEEKISKMLKEGYRFAVKIDNSFEDNTQSMIKLNMFDFIIVTEDKYYYEGFKKRTNVIDFKN